MPDAQFFKKASAHLQDDIDDFDNYLCQTAADNFNLETISPEHMCRLECLVKLLGKELLDPLCDQADSQVGTFAMVVLLDALKYLGLAGEKPLPKQQFRRLSFKISFLKE